MLVFVLDLDGLSAGEALVVPKKALVHLIKHLKYLLKCLDLALSKDNSGKKSKHWKDTNRMKFISYLSFVRLIRSRLCPKLARSKCQRKAA